MILQTQNIATFGLSDKLNTGALSTYILGFALGPLLLASLSEHYLWFNFRVYYFMVLPSAVPGARGAGAEYGDSIGLPLYLRF